MAFYIVAAMEQNIELEKLTGTIQYILKNSWLEILTYTLPGKYENCW